MRYRAKNEDRETASLREDLEPVLQGLGFVPVELNLFHAGKRGAVQVRLVLTKPGTAGSFGTGELAGAHRAILPRLEAAFPDGDLHVELSSPGTDRLVKEGAEFRHYVDRRIRIYRTDTAQWQRGILRFSDTEKILLETEDGVSSSQQERIELPYELIAKARLDDSIENA
ncbi:MAG: ribosome assembly cofactor RimP [Spirochaetaceae bacterium]|jgi:ribosome maturation factor RimP|nr:ribosome assembly cofactor RimP [Spirochaetaceae bacterium]